MTARDVDRLTAAAVPGAPLSPLLKAVFDRLRMNADLWHIAGCPPLDPRDLSAAEVYVLTVPAQAAMRPDAQPTVPARKPIQPSRGTIDPLDPDNVDPEKYVDPDDPGIDPTTPGDDKPTADDYLQAVAPIELMAKSVWQSLSSQS